MSAHCVLQMTFPENVLKLLIDELNRALSEKGLTTKAHLIYSQKRSGVGVAHLRPTISFIGPIVERKIASQLLVSIKAKICTLVNSIKKRQAKDDRSATAFFNRRGTEEKIAIDSRLRIIEQQNRAEPKPLPKEVMDGLVKTLQDTKIPQPDDNDLVIGGKKRKEFVAGGKPRRKIRVKKSGGKNAEE